MLILLYAAFSHIVSHWVNKSVTTVGNVWPQLLALWQCAMQVFTPCVSSLVLPLQRAQARCLAVLDRVTGAARWRMMRWGGMYTETCNGNQTLLLAVVLLLSHSKHTLYCVSIFTDGVFSYRRRILGAEVTQRERKTSSGSSGRYVTVSHSVSYNH